MITLLDHGYYKLIETKNRTKVLWLGKKTFAWIEPKGFGDILIMSGYAPHSNDYSLSAGRFNLYSVKDEPFLVDLLHLELEFARGSWQGYLLLTGLPDAKKRRSRIVSTAEIITNNARYKTNRIHSNVTVPTKDTRENGVKVEA